MLVSSIQKTLVRPAVRADFPTLLVIDQSCFEPGIAYDSSELSYYMQRVRGRTLVAEVGSKIAGFLLMEMYPRRRSATLITLDIREEFRGKGCAAELLRVSEQILLAETIRRYDLQVDISNGRAIAFYKKHGFEISRVLSEYYTNGNDAYLMVKRFPKPQSAI